MNLNLERIFATANAYDWSLPSGRLQFDACGADQRIIADRSIMRHLDANPLIQEQVENRVAQRDCPHCVIATHRRRNSVLDVKQYVAASGHIRKKSAVVQGLTQSIRFAAAGEIDDQLAQLQQLIDFAEGHKTPLFAWLVAIFFLRTHPYPDGNGRSARNLAILLLLKWRIITSISFPAYALIRASEDAVKQALDAIKDEKSLVSACHIWHAIHRDSVRWMIQNCNKKQP